MSVGSPSPTRRGVRSNGVGFYRGDKRGGNGAPDILRGVGRGAGFAQRRHSSSSAHNGKFPPPPPPPPPGIAETSESWRRLPCIGGYVLSGKSWCFDYVGLEG